jgi:glucose-1-phosphate cytidylyltransferase
MKVVILAGGLGTRISEETHLKPKPMIEIGGRPLLWHLMKIYSHFGLNEFIICCGYKGYIIKEYFQNYFLHCSDVTFDFTKNSTSILQRKNEPWKVTIIDTGDDTMTGGRLRRIKSYVKNDKYFCMTYGDGLGDINISELISFHEKKGKNATVTAVSPPARFGALDIQGDLVSKFTEKPDGDGTLINGGFFVLSPKVLDLIEHDNIIWEKEPLQALASAEQLSVFKHKGFWQPMDTLRDKNILEDSWSSGKASWKLW